MSAAKGHGGAHLGVLVRLAARDWDFYEGQLTLGLVCPPPTASSGCAASVEGLGFRPELGVKYLVTTWATCPKILTRQEHQEVVTA